MLQIDLTIGPMDSGMRRAQSMKCPSGRKANAARNRTSRYVGVGSSNRKNQWQARILVHGKVSGRHGIAQIVKSSRSTPHSLPGYLRVNFLYSNQAYTQECSSNGHTCVPLV